MSTANQLRVASISGIVSRHASHVLSRGADEPTADELAAAIEELRDSDLLRPDLLAEWAGILRGAHEHDGVSGPHAMIAAQICEAAGADKPAIPAWVEEGRRRAGQARQIPRTGT
jgi:hypothetical protein